MASLTFGIPHLGRIAQIHDSPATILKMIYDHMEIPVLYIA